MRFSVAFGFAIFGVVSLANAEDLGASVVGVEVVSVADVIDDDRTIELSDGRRLRLPLKKGAFVLSVSPFGPAREQLRKFDVIDRVGREAVDDASGFLAAISELPAGEPVRLSIRRVQPAGGKSDTVAGFYKKDRVEVSPVAREDLIRAAMQEERLPNSATVRYSHREAPAFAGPTGVDLFFTVDGDDRVAAYLNIRLQIEDWIFVERWTVNVDGSKFEIPGSSLAVSRDVVGGDDLREWEVVAVGPELVELVNRLEGADRVAVTFHGKDYYRTAELDAGNLSRLRDSVAAARVHGWKE